MNPDRSQQRRRTTVLFLVAAGTLLSTAGLIATLATQNLLFLFLIAAGLVDLLFALLFSTGRLGAAPAGSAPAGPEPADPDQAATEATDDPGYQPYERDDPA